MRLVYKIVYTIFFVAMFAVLIESRKSKSSLKKYIMFTLVAGIIAVLGDGLGLLFHNEKASLFAFGVYSGSIDWCLVCLLAFVESYTKTFVSTKASRVTTYVICALDALSLWLNVFFEHCFKVRVIYLDNGETLNVIGTKFGVYGVHLAICYVICAFIFLSLVVKSASSPKIYKRRYYTLVITFVLVLMMDFLGIVNVKFAGFPVLAYGFMGVVIYYYALRFVPLQVAGDLLARTVKTIQSGLIVFDYDSECIYANEFARAYAGITKDNMAQVGKSLTGWFDGRRPDEVDDAEWTETRGNEGNRQHIEYQYRKILDEKNKFVGFYFVLFDRTITVDQFASEKYKGTHDSLTGLLNKNGFIEEVEKIFRKEPEVQRLVVVSDIRNFKMINDIFGDDKGDDILKRIATEMSQHCLNNDSIPAHLGADKFAICMKKSRFIPEVFIDVPAKVVQMNDESGYKVMNVVGVYEIKDISVPVATMIDRAYLAIETIKDDYGQALVYYDDSIRNRIVNDQQIVSELRPAIKDEQFKIFIQPQVYVDGSVKGGEALARWVHPIRGMVPPGEFIPVLERTGLVSVLDKYVWELACEQLRKWKSLGFSDYYISVNISARDFYYMDIYETFTGLVEKYSVSPKNLKLEITESAVMQDFKKQILLLDRLREFGFQIEIDDFGSGYSSLNMLKDMSVDVLKIDMGFLSQSETSSKSKKILATVINMAKELGIEVVTEGVEREEQVKFLTEMGCDIFQGYYFSKPIPVEDFEEKYMGTFDQF